MYNLDWWWCLKILKYPHLLHFLLMSHPCTIVPNSKCEVANHDSIRSPRDHDTCMQVITCKLSGHHTKNVVHKVHTKKRSAGWSWSWSVVREKYCWAGWSWRLELEWCERKVLFGWSWSNKPNAVIHHKQTTQQTNCASRRNATAKSNPLTT